jgi:hypothetical protein
MEGDPADAPWQMERWALATFVATVETQQQTQGADDGARSRDRDRRFGALLTSGLTVLAVSIAGYHPYADDGGLYVAGVKRLLDPALYPLNTQFVLEPMRHSLFAHAVAGMVRLSHLDLPAVLLLLHLASIWLTLLAAWMLAERCWETREARSGAVALLACWLGLPVAGTALMLMDPYVTARSFSTPCLVLALVGALDAKASRRGWALWAGSLLIGGAMHPLMTAYTLGATLVLLCMGSRRRSVQVWGTAAVCVGAVAIAACMQSLARPESAEYVRVALTRTYWFPAEWRWFEWSGLAAPVAILAVVGWRVRVWEATRALARMAVVVGSIALFVATLFAREGAATHLVARMQPLRSFQTVYLVMVLALGATLGERALRRSALRWGIAATLLGGTMFAASRGTFPDSPHLEMPGVAPRNAWVEAFLWVRDNTPKAALFALDADYIHQPGEDSQCFRAIAERSALADYSKDGGEASIAPELTGAWQTGQAAQQGLSRESDVARAAALAPLGVSWVVLAADATTRLDCPYANSAVKVCRLR